MSAFIGYNSPIVDNPYWSNGPAQGYELITVGGGSSPGLWPYQPTQQDQESIKLIEAALNKGCMGRLGYPPPEGSMKYEPQMAYLMIYLNGRYWPLISDQEMQELVKAASQSLQESETPEEDRFEQMLEEKHGPSSEVKEAPPVSDDQKVLAAVMRDLEKRVQTCIEQSKKTAPVDPNHVFFGTILGMPGIPIGGVHLYSSEP